MDHVIDGIHLAMMGSIPLTLLKATGIIDWAWTWTLAPIWISLLALPLIGLLTGLRHR